MTLCPVECQCVDHSQCLWSVDLMQKIEAARILSNSELWNSYISQYRQQICSFNEKKVCCCQSDQPNFSNEEAAPSIKYGKAT